MLQSKELLPKLANKDLVSITHYGLGNRMELEDMIIVELATVTAEKGWDKGRK